MLIALIVFLLTATPTLTDADRLWDEKRWNEAAAAYRAVVDADPANGRAWYRLAFSLHQIDRFTDAASAFERAAAAGVTPLVSRFNAACAWSRAGEKEKALNALESLAAARYNNVGLVKTDSDLEPLRNEPRFQAVLQKMQRNIPKCADDPVRRQLDFWVGEWEVFAPNDVRVGESTIQLSLDHCLILEHWRASGGAEGRSFNGYDPTSKKWRQFWMSSRGGFTAYEGEQVGAGIRLIAQQTSPLIRMTLSPNPDGSVRQLAESSADGGKTWTVQYDFRYVKRRLTPPHS